MTTDSADDGLNDWLNTLPVDTVDELAGMVELDQDMIRVFGAISAIDGMENVAMDHFRHTCHCFMAPLNNSSSLIH